MNLNSYLIIFFRNICSSVEESMIRSYKRSFNGFAANLTEEEVEELASTCCNVFFKTAVINGDYGCN